MVAGAFPPPKLGVDLHLLEPRDEVRAQQQEVHPKACIALKRAIVNPKRIDLLVG